MVIIIWRCKTRLFSFQIMTPDFDYMTNSYSNVGDVSYVTSILKWEYKSVCQGSRYITNCRLG
jgi:hypothetical protein